MFGLSRHGHRDHADIKRSGHEISVVFDVGANMGSLLINLDLLSQKHQFIALNQRR
ncbi:MAG: hypothetical protein KAJ14_07530 [Candidatus Omnitrophica bacterium]|nr:hypothetical protein [Candidatus Omnitrophota bacterium]